ncbi:hypothetical protein, partial [Herpetosiphon geysericola]
ELTDGMKGIFEWSTDQIAIHIDPHAAKALTEAAIWQTQSLCASQSASDCSHWESYLPGTE